jgi:hypothetical protein
MAELIIFYNLRNAKVRGARTTFFTLVFQCTSGERDNLESLPTFCVSHPTSIIFDLSNWLYVGSSAASWSHCAIRNMKNNVVRHEGMAMELPCTTKTNLFDSITDPIVTFGMGSQASALDNCVSNPESV